MPPFASPRPKALRRCLATGLAVLFAVTALGLVVSASPTSAAGTPLYAYAAGGATSPTSCPRTTTTSEQCTLAEALSLAAAGGTVLLATAASAGHYVGNWTLSTPGTSASVPLTIKPALGVANPTLDGNYGNPTGCQTTACDGPVLTISPKVHLDLDGVTIQDAANATVPYNGGAIDNVGGTVAVSASTFSGNTAANDGGAIDNADGASGGGTVAVSASTFSSDTADNDGGAIDNADYGGNGTLSVSASTFSGNSAERDNGGAIDNGDYGGKGTLAVSASTFSWNSASNGGAIDNADSSGGSGGTVAVSASTFSGNTAVNGGGAIDNADYGGKGTLSVWASTFSVNLATHGGAIDNGSRSTVWAAADILNGTCHNAAGTWDDEGYNVGAAGTCLKGATGDIGHGANQLGPLAHNGGPTETMLPLAGNPALGAIPNKTTAKLNGRTVTLCPTTDQRGTHSASGHTCNAGAVQ